MKKCCYTAIFLALLLAVLPACGFAYYESGAPTPEDAIEQYYWGQYMLNAPMTIEVTQFSDGFANAIRKHSTADAIRSLYGEEDLDYYTFEIEHFDGDLVEWFIYNQSTDEKQCLEWVYQDALNEGTIPYQQNDIEIQFYEVGIPAPSDHWIIDMTTVFSDVGIPISNTAVTIVNIVDKKTNHIVTKEHGLFQIDNSWYVYDPCNWHYYVE